MIEYGDERRVYSRWMATAEVSRLLAVSPKTIARWASAGFFERENVRMLHTIGGHRRYRREDIEALATRLETTQRSRVAE